jgi:hypothetical protein
MFLTTIRFEHVVSPPRGSSRGECPLLPHYTRLVCFHKSREYIASNGRQTTDCRSGVDSTAQKADLYRPSCRTTVTIRTPAVIKERRIMSTHCIYEFMYSRTRLQRHRFVPHLAYTVRFSITNQFVTVNHNIILLGYDDTKYSVPSTAS